jgi:NitT/TauT family transport system permease protein
MNRPTVPGLRHRGQDPDAADPSRVRAARAGLWSVVGVAAILLAWTVAATSQPSLILPSPRETAEALGQIALDGTLIGSLRTTLGRAAIGVGLGVTVGIVWGAVAGRSPAVAAATQPALSTMMALPPVILVVVGLVWFGTGGAVPAFVIALVALPLIVIAVREAVRNVDPDLLEMAETFALPRWRTLRHIVLPAVASPVLAAITVTVGQALRVSVMAELLARPDGVGALIARSRANLDTAQLFAWAGTLVVTVITIETLLLRPLSRYSLRWRETAAP